jgi:hypothetical protein
MQKPPELPMSYNLRLLLHSMWTQGARSTYRTAYWKFVWRILRNYINNPAKLWMGSMILLAGHHFLIYAREVAKELAGAIPAAQEPISLRAEAAAPRF